MTFPNRFLNSRSKGKSKCKQTKVYRYLGKAGKLVGAGRKTIKSFFPLSKHGREVRKGVYQVRCGKLEGEIKGCYLPASILIGRSLLDRDEKCTKIESNLNSMADKFFTV